MNKQDLIALAERVEKAEGPDRGLDALIKEAVGDAWDYAADWGSRENYAPVAKAYSASLDAAMTLVPEGHVWTLYSDGCAGVAPRRDDDDLADASTWAATPALALCSAALRARAREEG